MSGMIRRELRPDHIPFYPAFTNGFPLEGAARTTRSTAVPLTGIDRQSRNNPELRNACGGASRHDLAAVDWDYRKCVPLAYRAIPLW